MVGEETRITIFVTFREREGRTLEEKGYRGTSVISEVGVFTGFIIMHS